MITAFGLLAEHLIRLLIDAVALDDPSGGPGQGGIPAPLRNRRRGLRFGDDFINRCSPLMPEDIRRRTAKNEAAGIQGITVEKRIILINQVL